MMDKMEKRKKKLELELLRGILGAIEADIDLEHDFSELLEGAPIKGRKTVPRQTNPAPDESNVPPCESNIASRDAGAQASEEAVEAVLSGGTVLNPYSYNEMEIPKVGDRVFMVYASTDGLAVLADYFHGTTIELLMLAQSRLFTDRKDAEAHLKECRGVIAAIVAQLDI